MFSSCPRASDRTDAAILISTLCRGCFGYKACVEIMCCVDME